jgi:ribosomal protein S18 acetylase RimI-like enzyme
MPLKLLPMQASDIDAWARLNYFTFRQTIGRVMWTHDPSEETFALLAQDRLKELQTPNTVHHKIVDTDTDPEKPIAFASWQIFRTELTQEELDAHCAMPTMYPGRNKEAILAFWSGLFGSRDEVIGARPHIYLTMLATHPDYQRRGAGSMLMQWAADEGDRLGLEVFIEASPPGRILYSKFGFETVKQVLFKGAPFGVDVDELTSVRISLPCRNAFSRRMVVYD